MSFNNHKAKEKGESFYREPLDSKHVLEEDSKEVQVRVFFPNLAFPGNSSTVLLMDIFPNNLVRFKPLKL